MSLVSCWEKAQPAIKEKIGSTTYETWFSVLSIREKSPATLVIETPDEFFKNWLIDHYSATIKESLNNISSKAISVEFEVNPGILSKNTQTRLIEFEKGFEEAEGASVNLSPRFSFENFVVGSSNRFAHAACLAVAESPAKAYNPLFIYGGVGLGKTHLMQAIANKIRL